MPQLNPGLAKGYALDFAAPLRFVAEALAARDQTLDELVDGYEHDASDLDRVWDHELRERGQRRSAKPEVQQEHRGEAKRWLVQAAVDALGDQVRRERGCLMLAIPLNEAKVGGLPVAFDPALVAEQAASRRTKDASDRRCAASPAKTSSSDRPAAPSKEPPRPRNPFREWVEAHAYTGPALARALGMERDEVDAYFNGERPAPRVVLLALWAIDHGAEI